MSNQGIEPSAWPGVVQGTSFSTTACIPDTGAVDPSGNPLCLFSTIQCTYTLPDGTTSTPAGDNCPQSTAKNVQMYHKFDSTSPLVTNFPKGTGLGFLEGSDSWPSMSCAFVGPECELASCARRIRSLRSSATSAAAAAEAQPIRRTSQSPGFPCHSPSRVSFHTVLDGVTARR